MTKTLIPCPCGNPDHPHVLVYDPDMLHTELADFVSDIAGFTYGSVQDEPTGLKGEINILWQTRQDGPCGVFDAVFDGEHWRNTYRWSAADQEHTDELRSSLGPSELDLNNR